MSIVGYGGVACILFALTNVLLLNPVIAQNDP